MYNEATMHTGAILCTWFILLADKCMLFIWNLDTLVVRECFTAEMANVMLDFAAAVHARHVSMAMERDCCIWVLHFVAIPCSTFVYLPKKILPLVQIVLVLPSVLQLGEGLFRDCSLVDWGPHSTPITAVHTNKISAVLFSIRETNTLENSPLSWFCVACSFPLWQSWRASVVSLTTRVSFWDRVYKYYRRWECTDTSPTHINLQYSLCFLNNASVCRRRSQQPLDEAFWMMAGLERKSVRVTSWKAF